MQDEVHQDSGNSIMWHYCVPNTLRSYVLLGVLELVEVLATCQQLGLVLLPLKLSGRRLRWVDLFESVDPLLEKSGLPD